MLRLFLWAVPSISGSSSSLQETRWHYKQPLPKPQAPPLGPKLFISPILFRIFMIQRPSSSSENVLKSVAQQNSAQKIVKCTEMIGRTAVKTLLPWLCLLTSITGSGPVSSRNSHLSHHLSHKPGKHLLGLQAGISAGWTGSQSHDL